MIVLFCTLDAGDDATLRLMPMNRIAADPVVVHAAPVAPAAEPPMEFPVMEKFAPVELLMSIALVVYATAARDEVWNKLFPEIVHAVLPAEMLIPCAFNVDA